MTARPEVIAAELRALVVEALRQSVDARDEGFAALMRNQLRHAEADAARFGPAVFCLALGRMIAGDETRTQPAAVALGLLEEMGHAFAGIESSAGGDTAVGLWGMPRALNAGDAFYALGHHLLLHDEALSETARLAAASVYTRAARAYSEALHAHSPEGAAGAARAARVLYPAAVALATLCCGLDDVSGRRLHAIAQDLITTPRSTLDGALHKAAALNLQTN
jgi:hypothetical protein